MRRAALPIVSLLLFFVPLAPAQDESPAELRREIDRLTEQISELEARLERSQQRIDDLVAENRRLLDRLRDGGGAGGETAGEEDGGESNAGELPLDPFACPDSMRASLERSWDEEFAGTDVSDEQQSRRYLRSVRSWAGKARRDHRGDIAWRVNVIAARSEGRSTVATVQVIDAEGRTLGEPGVVEANGAAAQTLLQARPDAVLLIEGKVDVDIDIDARAGEAPDEIGPYLRTTYDYRVTDARYE